MAAPDLDAQLTGNLTVVAQQGVADNQRLSQFTQLAFTKDLMQSGQESNPGLMSAFNAADRTPVIKTVPAVTTA